MSSIYLCLKAIHVTAVLTSGALFTVRGLGVLAGGRWPNARRLAIASYLIDTVLLAAALALLAMLRMNPLLVPWLATKLALLVVYVVLGSFALRRARGQRQRWVTFLTALACYGLMVSIARAHHPLGILHTLRLF